MVASLATVDDLAWSLTARDVQVEVRTAPAPAGELLTAQKPRWLQAAVQELAALTALPDNWDSYGARPVSISTASAATQLVGHLDALRLPLPKIVPLASGGVQFEWSVHNLELELSLEPDEHMTALFDDTSSGESWERELPPRDLTSIRDALRRLARAGHSG
jgi:hypothetical protein